jgi:hypothetical protein
MRFRYLLATSCLAATVALVPAAGNAGPWVPAPKEYSTEIRADFFSANDFHFTDGKRNHFAGGGHLDDRRLTFAGELGWKKNLSVMFALPFVQVSRVIGSSSATATGAGDLLLGVRYRVLGGDAASHSALALELGWKAPLGYDRSVRLPGYAIEFLDTTLARQYDPADSANVMRQQTTPRIGEGQQDLQGLLLFGVAMPGWKGFVQGGAGYRYRFDEPNDQILLGADLGWWLSNRLLLSGHYTGAIAINPDEDRDPDGYTEHLVGPRLTVRVDDRFDMFAGSLHTPAAENAPHKDQVYVGFTMKQTGFDRFQGFLGGTKTP